MSNFSTRPNQISGKKHLFDEPGIQYDFLQWIPATVSGVINSGEAVLSQPTNHGESNLITVKQNIWTPDVPADTIDNKKFKPLFRGFADSITIDEEVLVTFIGDEGFYLGPINLSNNPSLNQSNKGVNVSSGAENLSASFPKKSRYKRLNKHFKLDLDDPLGSLETFTDPLTKEDVLSDLYTDTTIEGRFGNSINIGGRNTHPYIFISNGRGVEQSEESINDGSILSMTTYGSVFQHFPNEYLDDEPYQFLLGDESIEEPQQTIRNTFFQSLGRGGGIDGEDADDVDVEIYEYNKPQTILNSDRIIINGRKDSLYLSAFQHIHLGSGNTMTFSTSRNVLFNVFESFVVNSPEIKLGSQDDELTQPIVLGDTLIEKLTELNDHLQEIITQIQAITVPTPAGPSGPPVNSAAFNMPGNSLQQLIGSLEDILSKQNRTV